MQSLWRNGQYDGDPAAGVRRIAEAANLELTERARGAAPDHLGCVLLLWAELHEARPEFARLLVEHHLPWAELVSATHARRPRLLRRRVPSNPLVRPRTARERRLTLPPHSRTNVNRSLISAAQCLAGVTALSISCSTALAQDPPKKPFRLNDWLKGPSAGESWRP